MIRYMSVFRPMNLIHHMPPYLGIFSCFFFFSSFFCFHADQRPVCCFFVIHFSIHFSSLVFCFFLFFGCSIKVSQKHSGGSHTPTTSSSSIVPLSLPMSLQFRGRRTTTRPTQHDVRQMVVEIWRAWDNHHQRARERHRADLVHVAASSLQLQGAAAATKVTDGEEENQKENKKAQYTSAIHRFLIRKVTALRY